MVRMWLDMCVCVRGFKESNKIKLHACLELKSKDSDSEDGEAISRCNGGSLSAASEWPLIDPLNECLNKSGRATNTIRKIPQDMFGRKPLRIGSGRAER